MSKKKDIDEIRKAFSDVGYTLLSDTYKNNKVPLDFICDKGHTTTIRWANFVSGQRCGKCSSNKRLSYKEVKEAFESRGYKLLTKDYINKEQKLNIVCPNGHKSEMTYGSFNYQSSDCKKCYEERVYNTTDKVRAYLLEYGFVLLSEYKNNYTPLIYKCREGHITARTYNNFLHNSFCTECSFLSKRRDLEFVKNYFNFFGYKLISYIGDSTELMEVECPNLHRSVVYFCNFSRGHRCKYCYKGPVSKASQEWLDSLGIPVEKREITLPDLKFRVDAFMPETNTTYEFFGDYWHGNPDRFDLEDFNKHNGKTFGELYEETKTRVIRLRKAGYKIIYIWENDFYLQNKVESS